MEPQSLISQALDKYGPLGAALVTVIFVFIFFVWKVVPLIFEAHGKRIDAMIEAYRESNVQRDATSTDRHGELVRGQGEIKGVVKEISVKIDRLAACKGAVKPCSDESSVSD